MTAGRGCTRLSDELAVSDDLSQGIADRDAQISDLFSVLARTRR